MINSLFAAVGLALVCLGFWMTVCIVIDLIYERNYRARQRTRQLVGKIKELHL